MTPIFRAPMRARDRDLPPGAGAEHGLRHGLVGAHTRIDRFAALPDGVFVWTRDTDGAYHLGRIAGPCSYDDSPAAREVGMHHVRPADWLDRPFGEGEVPADVAATFARGGRNFQQTHSAAAERRTAELWEAATADID